MTGFKDGAASNSPFGGNDDTNDDDTDDNDTLSNNSDSLGNAKHGANGQTSDETDDTTELSGDGLPWIYQRNSITDGREKTVQLHLQRSTLDDQREAKTQIEQQLGESVRKADLREAALLVGLQHVDETADLLRNWGYDFE